MNEFTDDEIKNIKTIDNLVKLKNLFPKEKINSDFIDYNQVEQFLINKGFNLTTTFKDHIGLNNKVWLK
jgi:hypothetical protein